jgi:hypothetical protein
MGVPGGPNVNDDFWKLVGSTVEKRLIWRCQRDWGSHQCTIVVSNDPILGSAGI